MAGSSSRRSQRVFRLGKFDWTRIPRVRRRTSRSALSSATTFFIRTVASLSPNSTLSFRANGLTPILAVTSLHPLGISIFFIPLTARSIPERMDSARSGCSPASSSRPSSPSGRSSDRSVMDRATQDRSFGHKDDPATSSKPSGSSSAIGMMPYQTIIGRLGSSASSGRAAKALANLPRFETGRRCKVEARVKRTKPEGSLFASWTNFFSRSGFPLGKRFFLGPKRESMGHSSLSRRIAQARMCSSVSSSKVSGLPSPIACRPQKARKRRDAGSF